MARLVGGWLELPKYQNDRDRMAKVRAEADRRGGAVSAWNVYVAGKRVATVDLTNSQVPAFRERLGDDTAELWLAAYESGTLTVS